MFKFGLWCTIICGLKYYQKFIWVTFLLQKTLQKKGENNIQGVDCPQIGKMLVTFFFLLVKTQPHIMNRFQEPAIPSVYTLPALAELCDKFSA